MAELNPLPVFWAEIEVRNDVDVSLVGHIAETTAKELAFPRRRQAEARIVATELAQNLVDHKTLDGRIRITGTSLLGVPYLITASLDKGSGFTDICLAMQDGATARNSFGIGLGTVSRLADQMVYCSRLNGTSPCPDLGSEIIYKAVIAVELWPDRACPPVPDTRGLDVSALIRPFPGETLCGDAVHIKYDEDFTRIVLMDGTGHGCEAAESVEEAVRALENTDARYGLEMVFENVACAVSHTSGLGLTVMKLGHCEGTVEAAAVGNVESVLYIDGTRYAVSCQAGLLGRSTVKKLRTNSYKCNFHSLVFMYTDGQAPVYRFLPDKIEYSFPSLLWNQILFSPEKNISDDVSLMVWQWKKR